MARHHRNRTPSLFLLSGTEQEADLPLSRKVREEERKEKKKKEKEIQSGQLHFSFHFFSSFIFVQVLTRWVNHELSVKSRVVSSLEDDFKDGVNLCVLLEVLSKQSFKYHSNPTHTAKRTENVNFALDFINKSGFQAHGWSASAIEVTLFFFLKYWSNWSNWGNPLTFYLFYVCWFYAEWRPAHYIGCDQ